MLEKIVLNQAGIDWYLHGGGGVEDELRRIATNIAEAADANSGRAGDHRVEVTQIPTRVRAAVITDTWNAMHREADSRSLTRALDAARS